MVAVSTASPYNYDIWLCGTSVPINTGNIDADLWDTPPRERKWLCLGCWPLLYLFWIVGMRAYRTIWQEMWLFSEDYAKQWNYKGIDICTRSSVEPYLWWSIKTNTMKSAAMWFQWHKLYVPWQRKFALPKGYGQWESFQYERDCLIPRYAPKAPWKKLCMIAESMGVRKDFTQGIIKLWSMSKTDCAM